MVQAVADDIGVPIELSDIRIESESDAKRERMLGSPTIQVNGSDIDPTARGRDDFAMSCRVFGGADGLPPREMIAAALLGEDCVPGHQPDADDRNGCCS
jgi:hypothetical protein